MNPTNTNKLATRTRLKFKRCGNSTIADGSYKNVSTQKTGKTNLTKGKLISVNPARTNKSRRGEQLVEMVNPPFQ